MRIAKHVLAAYLASLACYAHASDQQTQILDHMYKAAKESLPHFNLNDLISVHSIKSTKPLKTFAFESSDSEKVMRILRHAGIEKTYEDGIKKRGTAEFSCFIEIETEESKSGNVSGHGTVTCVDDAKTTKFALQGALSFDLTKILEKARVYNVGEQSHMVAFNHKTKTAQTFFWRRISLACEKPENAPTQCLLTTRYMREG